MTESDRISRLEGMADITTERLGELNTNIVALNGVVNSRLESMDARMNSLEGRIVGYFLTLVGLWVTTIVAVLSVLVTILLRS